ncbi:hypothetical protein [Nonomuraea jabiensis]|uniref:MFS transporter n=1 Tax=Nonomuraea jabiensis TaxID=882448 RepID=A0A7W9LEF5_9ACTN|nr:hypothetical protein [Nonomuraea jabiensis]MBB5780790.1 hypothetical protein [Nonomuraea jabiensis]
MPTTVAMASGPASPTTRLRARSRRASLHSPTARSAVRRASRSAARGLPGELAAQVLAPAREAFAGGLNVAAGIAAVIAGGAAILALLRLRHIPPTG